MQAGGAAAERHLVGFLADGLLPAECADMLRVSIATVLTQLRQIYDKTGARGLQGLNRVLSCLMALRYEQNPPSQ